MDDTETPDFLYQQDCLDKFTDQGFQARKIYKVIFLFSSTVHTLFL